MVEPSTSTSSSSAQVSSPQQQTLRSLSSLLSPASAFNTQRSANMATNIRVIDLHARMGHSLHEVLRKMITRGMIKDAKMPAETNASCVCRRCKQGKMVQKPFLSNRDKRRYNTFELLHFNICGPMEEVSIGGSRYLLILVDEASGCMKGFCLYAKSESENLIKNYISRSKLSMARKLS